MSKEIETAKNTVNPQAFQQIFGLSSLLSLFRNVIGIHCSLKLNLKPIYFVVQVEQKHTYVLQSRMIITTRKNWKEIEFLYTIVY